MAKMDIINAAGRAYQTCWVERAYLMRLAVVPLLLKFVCFIVAFSTAGGESLRFMLIMLPAFFAEGWMLAHFARLLVLGQRWPFRPTGDMEADMDVLKIRARGVLSGMIVFVLINLGFGFLLYIVNTYVGPYIPTKEMIDPPEIPTYIALLSMFLMGFMFWGFRLMWLYIPYALNIRGRVFMESMKGLRMAVQLIALWILCFIPFFALLQLVGALTLKPISMTFGTEAASFVYMMMNVVMDTVKALVATAGVTFGWMQIFRSDTVQKA